MAMRTCQTPCRYGALYADQVSQNIRSRIQLMTAAAQHRQHRTPSRFTRCTRHLQHERGNA
ncbi:hypothetical protein TYRP_019335 [Tyrophagus putrescentiae]|nr:hypothetical protein TYRP_019335 [Tyrophagus putrescentiae]